MYQSINIFSSLLELKNHKNKMAVINTKRKTNYFNIANNLLKNFCIKIRSKKILNKNNTYLNFFEKEESRYILGIYYYMLRIIKNKNPFHNSLLFLFYK